MVSKITVARIPPAMTTVPADIRNALHQQPAEGAQTQTATRFGWPEGGMTQELEDWLQ